MLLVTLLSSLAGFSGIVGAEKDNFHQIKPIVVITGIDSRQPKESFLRCDSSNAWQATWKAHRTEESDRTSLDLDLDTQMVVAVFSENSRICLVDVSENASCIRLRYRPWGNSIVFVPEGDGEGIKNVKVFQLGRGELDLSKTNLLSYAFVVLPKKSKPVVIEEDKRRRSDGPAIWKERARLEAKP